MLTNNDGSFALLLVKTKYLKSNILTTLYLWMYKVPPLSLCINVFG